MNEIIVLKKTDIVFLTHLISCAYGNAPMDKEDTESAKRLYPQLRRIYPEDHPWKCPDLVPVWKLKKHGFKEDNMILSSETGQIGTKFVK